MPEITLETSDNSRVVFSCAEGQYVLGAAEAAGFYLPAICRDGVCGACHARVSDGRYKHGPIAQSALPDAPSGGVLLCRCRPEGDLLITLPYPKKDIRCQAIVPREATIAELPRAGTGYMALKLALTPDPALGMAAEFLPGQYMEVGIRDVPLRRAYSMANLPNWDGRFDFLIRLKPGGVFSTWLDKYARVGDKLQVRGPFGRFVLDESSTRPRCFIGGGFGFGAVLSMLRHLAQFQDTQPTTLIFGANQQDEQFETDAIAELKAALPMLRVIPSVWFPQAGPNGFVRIVEAFAAVLEQGREQPDVYACGPQELLDSARSVAAAHHVPASQIFTEQLL
jgi:ferredoxin-NADP reductase/ferredoxin